VDKEERRMKIKEELEEIWENDIMSNFAEHWDYQKHCPKRANQSKERKMSMPRINND
jgi:hypothetical protein